MMSSPEDFGVPPLRIEEQSGNFPLEKFTRKPRKMHLEVPSAEEAGRIPPQAVDIEKAVLGATLIAPEAVPRAIELLRPEAFYDHRHQRIFQAIVDLFERNNPVDLVTLTEELRRKGILEDIGGPYYLTELTSSVASAANVEYHARIIAEKYLLRRLIATMTRLAGMAYDPGADAFELLDQAEQEIFRISESELRRPASSLKEVVKQTIRRMEALQGREGLTGIPSGFHALDALTGGWQPSDLIIVAARPSMGKTAFALSLARNAALHREYGTGVAIFSLEMSAEQLAQRLLTSEARVSAQLARTGRLQEEDWRKLAFAAGRLSEASIFIDDTPSIGVLELRAKCRRLKAEHDIGLVLVDYLQLMQGGKEARNREQEIAHISRSLKALAKELNVPVIALSQLSRAVETRGGDKRPQLSDLRESGCLTGDTLITLTDGRRVPIRELVGKTGFTVWALDLKTYRLQPARVSRAFSTGVKPVYRLITRLGRSIRATANHRFLTPEGWKRVDELQAGMHLALPRHIPGASETTLSEAELALLGHLIGDGCTLPRHTVQYTTCEEELAIHMAGLAQDVFGLAITPRIKQGQRWYQVDLCANQPLARGRRNPISVWLDEFEIFGLHSHEKRVPRQLFQQNMSRTRALRIAEVAHAEELLTLAKSDVYWDPVVSIELDGIEEVFDLTVPGPHNFVANDIIAHNSIEQDADVVLFIYRAERYGILTDEHGHSTEGIAEIIVGKQRNGPIGSIKLAFVKEYARFENLATYTAPEMESGDFLPPAPEPGF